MKSFLAYCLLIALVYADDSVPTREQEYEYRKECLKLENVPENLAEKVTDAGVFPDDPIVHCYIRCTMTKNGVWDDKTGYSPEKFMKFLEPRGSTIDAAALEKCNSKNEEELTSCKWAYKGFTCIVDNNLIKPAKSV